MAAIDLPLHRTAEGGNQLGGLLKEGHLLAVVVQIELPLQLGQAVIHLVLALIQQPGKGLTAISLDELIRVFGPLHP